MVYEFKTCTTMKEYNRKKWWIDSGIVREMVIEADDLLSALEKYREKVKDSYYIYISNNALKTKAPMYIDVKNEPIQKGYVITAYTYFEDEYYNDVKQFIDLWIDISTLHSPFIE